MPLFLRLAILCMLFAGCVSQKPTQCATAPIPSTPTLSPSEQALIETGRNLIVNGEAECLLIQDGVILAQARGRGASPLLTIYDTHRDAMANGIIVDKVIGKATAAILLCGKVKHIHAELISDDAIRFLQQSPTLTISYTKRVPHILNRKMDGLCPLEATVKEIDAPEAALAALRAKIEIMKQAKGTVR